MKILFDTCVWGGAKVDLSAAGHDVVWAGDWTADPGDEEILNRAHREGRILVTLPHSGILRRVDFPARRQGPTIVHILSLHGEELLSGALLTAEQDRLRIRPPETSAS